MENYKDLLKSSILKIQQQDRRIAELEHGAAQPIAIIGMSARFPGGADLERFWNVIETGADAVSTMTDQRWDMDAYYADQTGLAGRINTRRFGLLDAVDQFDPAAFGISEAEAENIDPQHRLLLEQAWFCLERAGFDVGALKGSDVGVFVGQMNNDYARLIRHSRDLNAYFGIGNALSAAAGRLSYVFGLKGPSLSLDTACSSSLVAVHLACQSLRLGECSMALAGGVNLLLSPEAAIGASVARMLSPSGRCNTFGSGADGYVRAEGCGLVLLKSLARAEADGDAVLAVIRGTAVNHDGRSNGMSAPSGPAQMDVLRRALADARVDAAEVGYVETHGTGTPLGDPVEVQAIDAVYGRADGRVVPLQLGAVKANIGHGESAAGIAGLIKLVLMLQHGQVPAIAHLHALNPHLQDISEGLQFPRGHSRPWPETPRRIGAVSSFGYTGTNAHLVVERAPRDAAAGADAVAWLQPCVLCYSAHSVRALQAQLRQTLQGLDDEPDLPLAQRAASVNRIRNDQPYRLALAVDSGASLRLQLEQWSLREPYRPAQRPALVYFFAAAGAITAGDAQVVRSIAAAAWQTLHDALQRAANLPLDALLDSADSAHPALRLLATQYLHAAGWLALGAIPQAVQAQGRGVLAAAAVAGVLPLEQAVALAVALDDDPASALPAAVDGTPFSEGRYALYASDASGLDAFPGAAQAQAVAWMQRVLAQTAPAPVALADGQLAIDLLSRRLYPAAAGGAGEERPQPAGFAAAVVALFHRGGTVDARALGDAAFRYPGDYPFERRRYWLPAHITERVGSLPALFTPLRHGIFSTVLAEPGAASLFAGEISLTALPFLSEHVVGGDVLLPASAFVDLLLSAGTWQGRRGLRLTRMEILQPCVLGEQPVGVYCRLSAAAGDTVAAEIHTREHSGSWRRQVAATLQPGLAGDRHHDLPALQRLCPVTVPVAEHYAAAQRDGVSYGPLFQAIRSLSRGPGVALATIELPALLSGEQARHHLHPVLLDACFQVVAAAAGSAATHAPRLYVPAALHGLDDSGMRPAVLRCFVRILGPQAGAWHSDAALQQYLQLRESFAATLTVCDESGREILAIERFEATRLRRAAATAEVWRDWIYQKTWIAADADSAAGSTALAPLLAFAREQAQHLCATLPDHAAQASADLDALALTYVQEAFDRLGIDASDAASLPALLGHADVAAGHARLCHRLVAALQAGPLARGPSSAELQARLRRQASAAMPELDLLQRCAGALADVLRGRVDPLLLLFGTPGAEPAPSLYEDTPGTLALNRLIAAAVGHVADERRGRGPLRVLEVGAGSGASTRQVLDRLHGYDVEYTFSDISAHFLNRAQQRFGAEAGLRYRLFDVSADPAAQGFQAGEFDIVIAVNVLHATPDLAQSLAHIRHCLADGGLLLLRELTRPQLWLDLTFGLTPGWWNASDRTLRADGPLLDPARWQALLHSSGFEAELLTPTAAEGAESVLLARRTATQSAQHWLLFSAADAVSASLRDALQAAGHTVSVVLADTFAADMPGYRTPAASREDIAELLLTAERDAGPLHGIVYAWSLQRQTRHDDDPMAALEPFAKLPLLLCQTVLQPRWRQVELSFLTAGAQAVAGAVDDPLAALLWGHVFSFVNENAVYARLVDIDPADFSPAALLALLARRDECQWALRGSRRLIARLLPATLHEGAPARIRADATYLITGGYGDLGVQTAHLLAREGARHIVLLGRTTRPDSAALAPLRELGTDVHHVQADVADLTALREALDPLLPSLPPLRGIVHSVGVLEDGIVELQTWERYRKVLAPKVLGALHLDRFAQDHALDFFVLYSSASGVMGNPGQANHAAANAFLDAFAVYRRGQGRPGLAIGWGAWSDIGAAATEEMTRRLNQEHALVGMIAPSQGRQIMALQFTADNANFSVVPLRSTVAADSQRQFYLQRLLAAVLHQPERDASPVATVADTADLSVLLQRHVGPQRRAELMRYLQSVTATLLRHDGAIDPATSLFDIGLDSLLAVDLRTRLEQDLRQSFDSTLLFDYPSLAALATFLLQTLEQRATAPAAVPAVASGTVRDDAIAVIGMGCRYPGGVRSPQQFWSLLSSGGDAVTAIPAQRWNNADYFDAQKFKPGKVYVNEGCFVDQVDQFYPERYGISGIEAELMDPQQRLLLDVCHEALEHAGIAPLALDGEDVGVFMGVMTQDYLQLAQNVREHPFFVGTGTANSVLAGRVAHVFGLTGPTMTVDTACSSSLVTVQLACLNLRAGSCGMALAGGVSLQLTPQTLVLECAGGMLSSSGRCRTFDADADGFVRGEGCGVVVLKRLGDAIEQGDAILGVIRGAAVTHDGRSGGLTVPNGRSQQRVLEKALQDAALAGADVSYVEAHGTGTALGDPIELNALQAVYGRGRGQAPLLVGSVKTNIGHAEAAAGVAGLQKVILALQHRQIPAHLHLRRPNPNFDWSGAAIVVPQTLTPWQQAQGTRKAGVSSFGLSGTNAHILVEEYIPVRDRPAPAAGFVPLALLSSISREQLAQDAARQAEFLASSPHDIRDVAFSLSVARASQPVRAVLTADSTDQLVANLRALAAAAPAEFVVCDTRTPVAGLTLVFDDARHAPAWAEYAEDYYHQYDAFRSSVDDCVRALHAQGGTTVDASRLCRGTEAAVADRVRHGVLQLAYARLLLSLGIAPQRVAAVGVGVFGAVCVGAAASSGQMVAALLHADDASELLRLAQAVDGAAAQLPLQLHAAAALPAEVAAALRHALGSAWVAEACADSRQEQRLQLASGRLQREGIVPWTMRLPPLARALIELVEIGQPIDWRGYFAPAAAHKVALPNSGFPSRRYWVPEPAAAPAAPPAQRPVSDLTVAGDGRRYVEYRLCAADAEFLAEHRIDGAHVLPAAGVLAFALQTLGAAAVDGAQLDGLSFTKPVVFDETVAIQLAIAAEQDAQLYFSADAPAAWQLFSTARRIAADSGAIDAGLAAAAWARVQQLTDAGQPGVGRAAFYDEYLPQNLQLGASYRRVHQSWRTHHAAVARIDNLAADFAVDPRVLDACMQTANFIGEVMEAHPDDLFLPASIGAFRLQRWPQDAQFWCVVEYRQALSDSSELVYDILVLDDAGSACAQFQHLGYRKASARSARGATVPAAAQAAAAATATLGINLAALPPAELQAQVAAIVRRKVADFLRIDILQVGDEKAFFDLGMDSITAVDFSADINDLFGLDLHVDAIFDYPSVGSLSAYLCLQLDAAGGDQSVAGAPPQAAATTDELSEMLRLELDG